MKKAYLLLILSIFLVSCQQSKQIDPTSEEYQAKVKEEITQFNKLFFEAWENENLETILSELDEGFINTFYFDMSTTKEECRDGFADLFDTYSIEDVEYESVDLIADQNYAVQTLLFQQKWITNDKQDTILFDLRSMSVFKKQEDGSWKWFRHIAQHNNDLNK
jgi:ketosteroid isomerase-like protein